MDDRASVNGLRIERVAGTNGLQALRDQWNDVLRRSSSNTLFLTWEWVSTWWEIYGHGSQLHVLVARDPGGCIQGIAPLKRTRRGILGLFKSTRIEFIGQGVDVVPDHLDIISARGYEAEVARRFAEHISEDPEIEGVDLRAFSGESRNLRPFVDHLRDRAGSVDVDVDSVCPIMPLPATVAEFLATRSKNYRKKLGEYERRCQRELAAELRCSTTLPELERDMRSLIELHRKRWAGGSRAFLTGRYVAFHERLSRLALEQGWTRLYTLESRSNPVAHLYCFAYDNRFYYYQAGWDPTFGRHRVGLVLMHKVIQEAIKDGATVFDFLRGQEAYKYRWSSAEVRNVRIVCWKKPLSRMIASLTGAYKSLEVLRRSRREGAPGTDW